MKTKNDLRNTFIICYNKEDWEKVNLILSSYIRPINYPWDYKSEYQYINISYTLSLGWGTSTVNNMDYFIKGLKQISVEELFKGF